MAKKYQMALDARTMIKDQSLLRHEDIKQHIQVLPELAAYIPPLLPEEYKQLEENIIQNGCREALLVWETTGQHLPNVETTATVYILIDGHNRYTICQQHQLDFKVHLMSFDSIESAKFFMIDNQLGRRNLTPEQVSYLRGLRYLREKQQKGRYKRDGQKGQNDLYQAQTGEGVSNNAELGEFAAEGANLPTTANRLGKQFKVSEKTIKRDGVYAQGLERLTPDFKQGILAGTIKVDKALVQQLGQVDKLAVPIRNQAELEQVLQQVPEKAASSKKPPQSVTNEKTVQLKQQLHQLVSQLNAEKVNLKQVCSDIIEYARQLQHIG